MNKIIIFSISGIVLTTVLALNSMNIQNSFLNVGMSSNDTIPTKNTNNTLENTINHYYNDIMIYDVEKYFTELHNKLDLSFIEYIGLDGATEMAISAKNYIDIMNIKYPINETNVYSGIKEVDECYVALRDNYTEYIKQIELGNFFTLEDAHEYYNNYVLTDDLDNKEYTFFDYENEYFKNRNMQKDFILKEVNLSNYTLTSEELALEEKYMNISELQNEYHYTGQSCISYEIFLMEYYSTKVATIISTTDNSEYFSFKKCSAEEIKNALKYNANKWLSEIQVVLNEHTTVINENPKNVEYLNTYAKEYSEFLIYALNLADTMNEQNIRECLAELQPLYYDAYDKVGNFYEE